MNRKASILFFLLNLTVFQGIFSQNINYWGLFPTIDHSGKLSNKWGYNAYLFDAIKPYESKINLETDKARSFYVYGEAGLSYNLTKNLSATAAYVHEQQNPFSDNYRVENRLFQQLTLKLPIGKTTFKQRLRFDERFVQNRLTGSAPLTHRLRYLLGFKQPLGGEKFYLTAYSEAFFNTSQSFKFDENWSALQLGYKFNDIHSFEAGLLYVGWINSAPSNWLNQFYLQATWVSQLDFSKSN
jgi:long-subunit fatty acid transport protein